MKKKVIALTIYGDDDLTNEDIETASVSVDILTKDERLVALKAGNVRVLDSDEIVEREAKE
jgi:hypothetical protein